MQRKSPKIEKTIEGAIASLKKSLDLFYPAYERNGFNERNLTYHFAREFEKRKNSFAFMEVPYYNENMGKYNKRIDCLAVDKLTAIFVESKRLYNSMKAKEILLDIERINMNNIQPIFDKLSYRAAPRFIYKLIIAETWQESVVDWWHGKKTRISWERDGFPADMYYSSMLVCEYDKANLYWLYGYILVKSDNITNA